MEIKNMFKHSIMRDINGVIKVGQDDKSHIRQELEEYVITKELNKHFNTFFTNYSKSINSETDKMGVWISGFFGSGKSHFLKILSHILSNTIVDDKLAVEYFEDKLQNPITFADMKKCTIVPTEAILFNIDAEGPINKDDTAVLRIFAKMFYNHCGFYGEDLKIAKLEQFIQKQGKTEEFRGVFKEINGSEWTDTRDSYAFFEDDIVEALQKVMGMSEVSCRNWFNAEENEDMSIKQLVAEVKEYVDNKGKNFKLLFMIDEVGQYIGDNSSLLVNLQTLVEELGSKCVGQVWVVVTSQEAIDSVVKISGDNFSKIQARFSTRLSLTSSSVDEVIQKRLLTKTEEANSLLKMVYEKEQAVIANLFSFNTQVLDIKGYRSADEFSKDYPFVPYQFIVLQKVLTEIRKHGNSGKHLSSGARSMLSGFQEAAQKVVGMDEQTLVPFYSFYDTIQTFLESQIRQVINRCQDAADNGDGVMDQDVNVLKLLYLMRYMNENEIKANIDNISILMIDNINVDKIHLRKQVADSLNRLYSQNYIARNGDVYAFLTDEEQDIATDIKIENVDGGAIIKEVSDSIFGGMYEYKKFKYNKYDFPFDQYVDSSLYGSNSGGMKLRIVTVASDYYNASEQRYILDSQLNNEAILLLPNDTAYFEELEQGLKIRKYLAKKNPNELSEVVKAIIARYRSTERAYAERAKACLENAILSAECYICGEKIEIKSSSVKDKFDKVLRHLTESVYSKLKMINTYIDTDANLLEILSGDAEKQSIVGAGGYNEDALNEISQWLEVKAYAHTSMGDIQRRYGAIPYGWREVDIAGLVARLLVNQKISIMYGGTTIAKNDKKLVECLRKKSLIDATAVTRRIAPSEDLKRKCITFMREYQSIMSIPDDEDNLIKFVIDIFNEKLKHYEILLANYAKEKYPEKEQLLKAKNLIDNILSQQKNNVALLNNIIQKQDQLLDSSEDIENIEVFFKTQVEVFDRALELKRNLANDMYYFSSNVGATNDIKEMVKILVAEKPYDHIKELPELIQNIKNSHNTMVNLKKDEVTELVYRYRGDVHELVGGDVFSKQTLLDSDKFFEDKLTAVKVSESLMNLDAMIAQLSNYSDTILRSLEAVKFNISNTASEDNKVVQKKIVTVRRSEVCSVKRIETKEDIDLYLDGVKEKLYKILEDVDGIQLN